MYKTYGTLEIGFCFLLGYCCITFFHFFTQIEYELHVNMSVYFSDVFH